MSVCKMCGELVEQLRRGGDDVVGEVVFGMMQLLAGLAGTDAEQSSLVET